MSWVKTISAKQKTLSLRERRPLDLDLGKLCGLTYQLQGAENDGGMGFLV